MEAHTNSTRTINNVPHSHFPFLFLDALVQRLGGDEGIKPAQQYGIVVRLESGFDWLLLASFVGDVLMGCSLVYMAVVVVPPPVVAP
jgi:hypothetical protein